MLAVGRVGRPHGTRGEFVLHSYSGETDHLLRLTRLTLRIYSRHEPASPRSEKSYTVASSRRAHDKVLMRLEGFETPEAARTVSGYEVWVTRESAAPLAREEYYVADLVGCRVVTGSKESYREVGGVVGVIEGSADDYLEISRGDGSAILVPFRKEYIGEIDTSKGTVELIDTEIVE